MSDKEDQDGGFATSDDIKKKAKNLKIVIDNDKANQDELFAYEELPDEELGGQVTIDSKMDIDETVNEGQAQEEAAHEDDSTEFHVNLDKAPPTLKNTVLNEKIYINETKEESVPAEKNLDVVTEDALKELYESLEVTAESFVPTSDPASSTTTAGELLSNTGGLYKKNSIHLFGVDDLSTEEIFEFLKGYNPFAIEWINDWTCNVLWKNENHSLNALIDLTVPYTPPQTAPMRSTRVSQPPKAFKWRISFSAVPKTGRFIFMRFARPNDRKIKGAESRSQYYVRNGNPNYGNITGLISESRRKRMKEAQLNKATADLSFEDERNDGDDSARRLKNDDEEEEKMNDLLGRKLVSYNIEFSAFRQKDELEEFGTGTAADQNSSTKIDIELAKKKPMYKSKKMHLYSDELNSSTKRSRRHDESDESDNNDDDGNEGDNNARGAGNFREQLSSRVNFHNRDNRGYGGAGYDRERERDREQHRDRDRSDHYHNRYQSNKRFNRYEPPYSRSSSNRQYGGNNSSSSSSSSRPSSHVSGSNDLRNKLNNMNRRNDRY